MDQKKYEPWYWLNEQSELFLGRGYLSEGQSAKERVREITDAAEALLEIDGFSDKLYDYVSRGWVSFSSPVWSNFGTSRGLPISCFGSFLPDNMAGILNTATEVGIMSKQGGGCSGYFGDLRPRGGEISQNRGESSGPVHFMQLFETLVDVVSQGSVRRGHFSPYMDIESPDIMEFLDIGTEGNPIQKLTHGVVVGDEWLQSMMEGDEEKRKVWAKLLQRRGEIGYPYIMYRDNANNNKPEVYKDYPILASNMCSEIMLPSNDDWSFVCCLSSVNLLHYDEWKETDLIETMTLFLNAVMEEFILKIEDMSKSVDPSDSEAAEALERAYLFALENRALGLGVLGWHSLLQSKMIPVESQEANMLNVEVFKLMRENALRGSKLAADELGESVMTMGTGRRNTTVMAIAPTTSSSFILGQVSQGIEPIWSNCYTKDLQKARVVIKNPVLQDLLEERGMNTKETWDSIRDNDGSVQHLEFLSEGEKAVFRTFAEIDQGTLIEQAGVRQIYIDQGQSFNLMVSPEMPTKEINQLYLKAWKAGVKSLYYQHSMNAAQQLTRKKICSACEA